MKLHSQTQWYWCRGKDSGKNLSLTFKPIDTFHCTHCTSWPSSGVKSFKPCYKNAYSPYSSPYISYGTSKESLSKYQGILSLVITCFILIAWLFVWTSSDTVKRNFIFVTVRAKRVKRGLIKGEVFRLLRKNTLETIDPEQSLFLLSDSRGKRTRERARTSPTSLKRDARVKPLV